MVAFRGGWLETIYRKQTVWQRAEIREQRLHLARTPMTHQTAVTIEMP